MDGQPDWLTQLLRQRSFGTDIPPGATQLVPPPQPNIEAPDINLRPGIEFQAPGQERNPFAEPGPPNIFAQTPSARELAPQPEKPPPDLFTRITEGLAKRPQLGSPEQQPSKFRKALGTLGGMSTGLAKGPEAGMQEHQDINEAPYRRHVRQWADTLAPLYGEAEQEAARTKHAMDMATTEAEYERAKAEHMRAMYNLSRINEQPEWVPHTMSEKLQVIQAEHPQIQKPWEPKYFMLDRSGKLVEVDPNTHRITSTQVEEPKFEPKTMSDEEKIQLQAQIDREMAGLHHRYRSAEIAQEGELRKDKSPTQHLDDRERAEAAVAKAIVGLNPRYGKFLNPKGAVDGYEYYVDPKYPTSKSIKGSVNENDPDWKAFKKALEEETEAALERFYGSPGTLEEDNKPKGKQGSYTKSRVVE
jgi:hypothetical protein